MGECPAMGSRHHAQAMAFGTLVSGSVAHAMPAEAAVTPDLHDRDLTAPHGLLHQVRVQRFNRPLVSWFGFLLMKTSMNSASIPNRLSRIHRGVVVMPELM